MTGVSAQRELIERAVAEGAQLVLVHHGLFWDFHPTGLTPVLAERLRPLFKHDVALAAYHLPLDAHPEVGNNAILAERLGCERHEPFGSYRGAPIGRAGTFPGDGIPAAELFERVREVTARVPTVFDGGPERVRRIGIVSGGGADALPEAIALGLDAFLTGEPREHVMADAREAGHPLHRRRPLRDRDVRRARAGRLAGRALRDRARLGRHPEPGLNAAFTAQMFSAY